MDAAWPWRLVASGGGLEGPVAGCMTALMPCRSPPSKPAICLALTTFARACDLIRAGRWTPSRQRPLVAFRARKAAMKS